MISDRIPWSSNGPQFPIESVNYISTDVIEMPGWRYCTYCVASSPFPILFLQFIFIKYKQIVQRLRIVDKIFHQVGRPIDIIPFRIYSIYPVKKQIIYSLHCDIVLLKPHIRTSILYNSFHNNFVGFLAPQYTKDIYFLKKPPLPSFIYRYILLNNACLFKKIIAKLGNVSLKYPILQISLNLLNLLRIL